MGQKVRRSGVVSSSEIGSSPAIGPVSWIVDRAGIRMVSFELSGNSRFTLDSAVPATPSWAGIQIISGSG